MKKRPCLPGFPDDSDAAWVGSKAGGTSVTMGEHAAAAVGSMASATAQPMVDGGSHGGGAFWSHTEFAWRKAVGPHVAASEEGRTVSDRALVACITTHLAQFADHVGAAGRGVALVETAGGVCSPGPSGSLQCDILRPLRLPAVLVVGRCRLNQVDP
jgi:dethiobiotin synthetase/adenosylmethionine--8-amino-7-oxononanoate aminotransferase